MMKRCLEIFTIILVTATFLGCEKEESANRLVEPNMGVTISLVHTRTSNDGFSTTWIAGDMVNVFHAESGSEDYINDGAFLYTEGNAFKGHIRNNLESGKKYDWYVSYPYDEKMTSPKVMPIHIPCDQYQSMDGDMSHLCNSYCPLAGKSVGVDGNSTIVVQMNHLVTVLKIKVTNYEASPMNLDLVSFRADGCTHVNEDVTIISNDAQTIAGSFNVDFTRDKISYSHVDRGLGIGSSRPLLHLKKSATLNLNESATVYMVSLPFHIANATTLTVGMNSNQGGITQGLYGKNVSFRSGQICSVRQGSRIEPPFKDGINFYHGKKNPDGSYEFQDGWWRCDLPVDFQFSGEFDFADLFYTCNTDDASISLLPLINQNHIAGNNGGEGDLVDRFNELSACCHGFKWVRNKRFGYNFHVDYGDKCGLFFNCYAGYGVGSWNIWFRLEDPFESIIKAVEGDWLLTTTPSINGADLWGDKFSAPTAVYGTVEPGTEINICSFYNSNPTSLDQDKFNIFYPNWRSFYVKAVDGTDLIVNDGQNVKLTEFAAKFCRQSAGIQWLPGWYRGYDKSSGEFTEEGAWDDAKIKAAAHGISITPDGKLVTSDSYDGFGFRFAPSLYFEYDYGYAQHIGTKYLPFIVGNI